MAANKAFKKHISHGKLLTVFPLEAENNLETIKLYNFSVVIPLVVVN